MEMERILHSNSSVSGEVRSWMWHKHSSWWLVWERVDGFMLSCGHEKWKEILAALPFLWWGEHGRVWAFGSLKRTPYTRIKRSWGPLPPYNRQENRKKCCGPQGLTLNQTFLKGLKGEEGISLAALWKLHFRRACQSAGCPSDRSVSKLRRQLSVFGA